MLAMKLLKEEAALTQRQVAAELGLRDGSGVSRRLAEIGKQLGSDPRLRKRYQRLLEQVQHTTPND
jgi:chromosomal replication initiation ATPase DnaA